MNTITRSITHASIVGSIALIGSLAVIGCERSDAPSSGTPATPSTEAANGRPDGRTGAHTATDQSESSEHIDTTARIRRAVVDDENLSMAAKNCTIITDSTGTVTLRGNVSSQAEKDAIHAKAVAVVGADRVVNQLVVAAR